MSPFSRPKKGGALPSWYAIHPSYLGGGFTAPPNPLRGSELGLYLRSIIS